jgi:hypothetical protein
MERRRHRGSSGSAAEHPTSSPSNKPRQQPGSACEECRRRRIRCNRATPQCQTCASINIPCVVRTESAPRGPKKGYIRALQKQIENLEAQISKQQDGGSVPTSTDPESRRTSIEAGEAVPGGDSSSLMTTNWFSSMETIQPWLPFMSDTHSTMSTPPQLHSFDQHQRPVSALAGPRPRLELSSRICTDL